MKTQKVYRYWIGKSDNKIHKSICEMDTIYKDSKAFYCIHDTSGNGSEFLSKQEFDDILKRTVGLSIYLYSENDDLARKHFIWAIKEQIDKAKAQVKKYEEILGKL